MYFEIDIWALALVAGLLFLIFLAAKWNASFASPSILFSNLQPLENNKTSASLFFAKWPLLLKYLALGLFLAAFLDPRIQTSKEENNLSSQGIAIYILADRSGSMTENNKLETLKQITQKFLDSRPKDLIGLTEFARVPHVLIPLTLDHKAISNALSKIQTVKSKEEDGTAIGYAIYKTVNYIDLTRHYSKSYEIKNSIIILITDGFQESNPLDQGRRLRNTGIMEAANYAKEKNIKLYFINVEPAFAAVDFEPHRNLFNQAAELTGGKFYMTASGKKLEEIYASIDQLEKSEISSDYANLSKDQQPNRYQRLSLYPYLIALAMLSLFTAILLETLFLRTVP